MSLFLISFHFNEVYLKVFKSIYFSHHKGMKPQELAVPVYIYSLPPSLSVFFLSLMQVGRTVVSINYALLMCQPSFVVKNDEYDYISARWPGNADLFAKALVDLVQESP